MTYNKIIQLQQNYVFLFGRLLHKFHSDDTTLKKKSLISSGQFQRRYN